jgi:hypothetical protein
MVNHGVPAHNAGITVFSVGLLVRPKPATVRFANGLGRLG